MTFSESQFEKKIFLPLRSEQTGERGIKNVRSPVNKLLQKSRQEMTIFKTSLVMGKIGISG